MREFIAAHPRKFAIALATFSGSCILLGCLMLVSLDQFKEMQRGIDAATQQALTMRTELNASLIRLNANVQPDCSEKTFQQLRAMLVHTRFIADFGILNDRGEVICNTTAGKLAVGVSLGTPDFSGKTGEGLLVSSYLGQPLPGVESTRTTVITTSGRFYAAPPADVLGDLANGKLSALQLKNNSTGEVKTAISSEALTEEWRTLLMKPAFVDQSTQYFDWEYAAFVQVSSVRGTFYIAQRVVPVSDFIARYLDAMAWAAMFGLLVGLLVYFALRPIFLSWQELEHRIERLLTRKNLLCMYQPIIHMATGRPVGCEVLMRIRDGDAIIPPDIAIPAITQRNLTWRLDQLVVGVAVCELRHALPDLIDFKVAFNFFPSSVSSGRIQEMFADVLKVSPHKGLRFDVEVLEQEYRDSMIQAVADLRASNFLVSVDDFGTGFSNLGNVKALLPDFLKIDRSFVQDMENATIRSSLIPEIIGIGRAVGAKLIAEGIENERQYAMLKGMGVDFGQGFLMCKPLPIDDFSTYMHRLEREI